MIDALYTCKCITDLCPLVVLMQQERIRFIINLYNGSQGEKLKREREREREKERERERERERETEGVKGM